MELFGKRSTDQDVANLFCMPQVLIELMEGCLGGASAEELTEVILQDGALSAKVLLAVRRTNNEFLNSFEAVSSAVKQLGDAALATLALQTARDVVRYQFTPQQLSFQYGLWYSSRVAGLFARCLAPSVNYPHIEEAQLCGSLLNIGIQALFARDREGYLRLNVSPWSDPVQCDKEVEGYETDHLQLGAEIVYEWGLESFLGDAIRFLSADIAQIGDSHQLLKIARLVQHLCKTPQTLNPETEQLAEQLLGLRQSEVTYLFEWATGLFPAFGRYLNDSSALQAELSADLQRVTDLSFLLADQESARARLAEGKDLDELLVAARTLYFEDNSAADAVFFFLDQKNRQLTGMTVPGQRDLIGEMSIPLDAELSLVASALLDNEPKDSSLVDAPLSVNDQILMRLCKGTDLYCFPLVSDKKQIGVVVLGIDHKDARQGSRFAMLGPVVSKALARMSDRIDDNFVEEASLLRRVRHEVNGALTVIGNYAGVLTQTLEGDKNHDMAVSIKNEVRRVDDILNYYLNQEDLPNFPEYIIDLNHALRDTVTSLEESEIKPRQIKVQYELQPDLGRIATNPLLVKQILTNLIKNAAEAVDDGGHILLTTREGFSSDQGRYVEIIVHNDGKAIDPAIRSRLFTPVPSTKGGGHAGVGLNIVKGMVDDLGGRISCHSSDQTGTSFHVCLFDMNG